MQVHYYYVLNRIYIVPNCEDLAFGTFDIHFEQAHASDGEFRKKLIHATAQPGKSFTRERRRRVLQGCRNGGL